MDFFNSLTLDLKMLVVAIAGTTLLAMFSGNHKSEKRYVLLLAVLGAVGVYRITHMPYDEQGARLAAQTTMPQPVTVAPKPVPLVSTSAR
ncbi:MAG TPA: hypothetical protein VGF26_19915 [Ramlibacter sp.]